MEWLSLSQQIITLIIGLIGLIGAAVGTFATIKTIIKANKDKSLNEILTMVQGWADEGMKEAEKSGLKGASKKEMVLSFVEGSAKAAGVEISPLLDQLSAYIDQTIAFVNNMKK